MFPEDYLEILTEDLISISKVNLDYKMQIDKRDLKI